MKDKIFKEEQKEIFEELKTYSSEQISDLLVDYYDSGLLTICGAFHKNEDIDKCFVALLIALNMLANNHIKIKGEIIDENC